MNSAKISVIIPMFNAEKTIEQCINSILLQSYNDFELILINDGSNDNTLDICKRFAEVDKRIKLFDQNNKGVSFSRNLGLENAEGKYIAYVDADDTVEKEYLLNLVNMIEQDQSDMVVACYNKISRNGRQVVKYGFNDLYKFDDFTVIEKLSSLLLLATPWGKLFIKDKIKFKFRTDISLGEDVCFVLDYMSLIDSMSILDMALYNYRIDIKADSLSKKYHKNLADVVKFVDQSKERFLNSHFNESKQAKLFRKISLEDDALLMISKVYSTRTSLIEAKRTTIDVLNLLNIHIGFKIIQNKKLKLCWLLKKLNLLVLLKLVYTIKRYNH